MVLGSLQAGLKPGGFFVLKENIAKNGKLWKILKIQTISIDLSPVFNNDLEFSLLADSGSTRKSFSGKQCACLSILQFFLFSLFFVLPGLPFHFVL
jgi:hypothetical protein